MKKNWQGNWENVEGGNDADHPDSHKQHLTSACRTEE